MSEKHRIFLTNRIGSGCRIGTGDLPGMNRTLCHAELPRVNLVPVARNRTCNLTLTKGALYHWSYTGVIRPALFGGQGGRTRTDGFRVPSAALYQLSYAQVWAVVVRYP